MITLRFEGGDVLARNLEQLSKRLSKKILVQALGKGGAIIGGAMAERAPRGDPASPNLSHVVTAEARTNTRAVLATGPANAAVAVGPSKDAFYGIFQEYGTVHHAAQPFARPAFDATHVQALEAVRQDIWASLTSRGIGSAQVARGTTEPDFLPEAPSVTAGPGGSLL